MLESDQLPPNDNGRIVSSIESICNDMLLYRFMNKLMCFCVGLIHHETPIYSLLGAFLTSRLLQSNVDKS